MFVNFHVLLFFFRQYNIFVVLLFIEYLMREGALMFNLSLTACSFHLRKTNSRGNTKIFNLNMPLTLQKGKIDSKFGCGCLQPYPWWMCGVAGSVLGTLTSTMISFTIRNIYRFFLIMWRGYRYSTAIVAGTHCAFLTMRGYNGI